MNTSLRRLFSSLALSLLLLPAAQAQHPLATNPDAEKPWPRVGFVEVFDGPKFIPSLGNVRGEGGDCIIDIANAGDGSGRLFFVTRQGVIYIFKDGKMLPKPFLDISALTTMDGERGLLSMAFPPDYKTKGHFYVYYTALTHDVTIARYKVDPKNPDQALPDGEVLLSVLHRKYSNHNGGQLHFGRDGMLYFGIGDGGLANDPDHNGQNLGAFLAKIIRIDVEGKPDEGKAYHVPSDNPFVKTPGALPEIWAFGVRNPFRWSFDPANGDMYIGNVGQDLWEQVYYAPGTSKGGENYGWSLYEGTHNDSRGLPSTQTVPTQIPITFPVAEFGHRTVPKFISITGGYVYRGKDFPAWQGVYFFSDWQTGQIWAMRRNSDGQWETHQVDDNQSPVKQTVTFGVDEQGNLYASGFADGKIYKLIEKPAGP